MTDLDDRITAGRSVYAHNTGLSEEQIEAAMTERAGAAYTREAYLAAGGLGWHSDQLTDRDRSIAVIAALVSQHVTDERLTTYLTAARNTGITEGGLEALMILLTAHRLPRPARRLHRNGHHPTHRTRLTTALDQTGSQPGVTNPRLYREPPTTRAAHRVSDSDRISEARRPMT